jgi:hypothetical protein
VKIRHTILLLCRKAVLRGNFLQKKDDADLVAAKDSEQLKALEEALKVHVYHNFMKRILFD